MKKKLALTIIGWLISVALIASLLAKMNFAALWEGFKRAQWSWLVFGALINLIVVAVKALRWQWIMEPGMSLRAERSNPKSPLPPFFKGGCGGDFTGSPSDFQSLTMTQRTTSYWAIFKATMIGLAGNNVLPARGGDWLKIYLLGNWAGASKTMLASVTGLDKIFDGLAIIFLFWIFSLHTFHFGPRHESFPDWVRQGTIVVSIVLMVSLAVCYLLLIHHRRTNDTENLGRFGMLAKKLGAGMGVLAKKHLIAGTIVVSLISTLLQIVTLWSCQKAFGIQLDPWIPAVVFVAINLAIIVPSAPSGVGPFEAAAVLAYAWIGLKTETAFNITLMYHAVQFFPVTILGFLFYFKSNRKKITAHELAVGNPSSSACIL
jgi:hypothetical protein